MSGMWRPAAAERKQDGGRGGEARLASPATPPSFHSSHLACVLPAGQLVLASNVVLQVKLVGKGHEVAAVGTRKVRRLVVLAGGGMEVSGGASGLDRGGTAR